MKKGFCFLQGGQKKKYNCKVLNAFDHCVSSFDNSYSHRNMMIFTSAFMQHTIADVKAEMEKTLEWLVPVATNTTKYVPIKFHFHIFGINY